jgi:hypothetical protein
LDKRYQIAFGLENIKLNLRIEERNRTFLSIVPKIITIRDKNIFFRDKYLF